MRDIIQIQETCGAGRWVKLQPGIQRTPTPTQNADGEVENHFISFWISFISLGKKCSFY